mmetsp:Transcript_122010/g.340145  ORF Transcript_122010/g.340145 Transcript_122010/m.340145 type:complete len:293 (+) Transcript_122010:706-1584(+)
MALVKVRRPLRMRVVTEVALLSVYAAAGGEIKAWPWAELGVPNASGVRRRLAGLGGLAGRLVRRHAGHLVRAQRRLECGQRRLLAPALQHRRGIVAAGRRCAWLIDHRQCRRDSRLVDQAVDVPRAHGPLHVVRGWPSDQAARHWGRLCRRRRRRRTRWRGRHADLLPAPGAAELRVCVAGRRTRRLRWRTALLLAPAAAQLRVRAARRRKRRRGWRTALLPAPAAAQLRVHASCARPRHLSHGQQVPRGWQHVHGAARGERRDGRRHSGQHGAAMRQPRVSSGRIGLEPRP